MRTYWEIKLFESIINALKRLNSEKDIINELEELSDTLTYLRMEIEEEKLNGN